MKEFNYHLINAAIAGLLVMFGSFIPVLSGEFNTKVIITGICVGILTGIIVFLNKFNDWFNTQDNCKKNRKTAILQFI